MECLGRIHYMQHTEWTLCSSFTAAAGKLISSSRSWQCNELSQCFPPATRQLLVDFFQANFWVPCQAAEEAAAAKYEPRHQSSTSQQTGQGTNSQVLWCSASSLQWNHRGTVSKSFFLVQSGIIFYLTKMMWGSIYCVSNRMGGPWMEGPTAKDYFWMW